MSKQPVSDSITAALKFGQEQEAIHRARLPQILLQEKIDKALATAFPHIKHDDAMRNAVTDYLRILGAHDPDMALDARAADLHASLAANIDPHRVIPGLFPVDSQLSANDQDALRQLTEKLVCLFPAYEKMAEEATKDDNRFLVRLGLNLAQEKPADHWRGRITQLRQTPEVRMQG